jgi:hypothetical protein
MSDLSPLSGEERKSNFGVFSSVDVKVFEAQRRTGVFHQQSIFFRKAGVQICSGPLLQAIAQFEAAEKRQLLGATTTVTTST